jgi:hypothetical protein
MRVVDQARARVTREGTVAEGRAVPRSVDTKPGVGDTVPELRTDNLTTIPFPVARSRYESERERERERADADGSANASAAPRTRRAPADSGARQDTAAAPEVTGWGGRRVVFMNQPAPDPTPSPDTARRRPEPSRTEEGDREALRPWFDKLRPREDGGAARQPREEQAKPRERERTRTQESPRPEPRPLRAEPKPERERNSPPPPPPPRNEGGAVRREKNRDQ